MCWTVVQLMFNSWKGSRRWRQLEVAPDKTVEILESGPLGGTVVAVKFSTWNVEGSPAPAPSKRDANVLPSKANPPLKDATPSRDLRPFPSRVPTRGRDCLTVKRSYLNVWLRAEISLDLRGPCKNSSRNSFGDESSGPGRTKLCWLEGSSPLPRRGTGRLWRWCGSWMSWGCDSWRLLCWRTAFSEVLQEKHKNSELGRREVQIIWGWYFQKNVRMHSDKGILKQIVEEVNTKHFTIQWIIVIWNFRD